MKKFLLTTLIFLVACSALNEKARKPASSSSRECFTLMASVLGHPERMVKNIDDFQEHTELHIQRVVEMGVWLYRQNKERFPDINEELLRNFLSQHDQGKVNRALTWGYPQRKAVIDRLYFYYGKSRSELTRAQQALQGDLINELNNIDDMVARKFFEENGLLDENGIHTDAAKQLLIIEKTSDLVDRGSNLVSPEEFGRPMSPASDWFKGLQSELARQLEESYESITRNLWYAPIP